MKQQTENIKKLKRAGTIIAIAGGLALGAVALSNSTDKDQEPKENKEYIKQLELAADKMTREQKLRFIQDGEATLEDLQKKIDSKETNPEERFDALRSRRQITQETELMKKKLNNER